MVLRADVGIVGGGLVGLSTALALLERGCRRVVVLEAEDGVARHQSGRNSGIIHSGLYYPPGSQKAELCVAGREEMYSFCAREGIPFVRTGKVVVAGTPEEVETLARLAEQGRANGLRGVEELDEADLAEVGEGVPGLAGLHVPETGIVDFAAVARVLASRIRERGGEVRTGWKVIAVRETDALRVRSSEEEIEVGALVNCAGVHADRIARLCGLRPDVRIIPFRGDYFDVGGTSATAIRIPIYPVPDPAFPFLGVHVHPTIGGSVKAGPNAVLALARNRYGRLALSPRDAAETLGFQGFWRLAARHGGRGMVELARASSRRRFLAAVQRLVPSLRSGDLSYASSGIRAQAVDRSGRLVDDFRFERGERTLHVLNSPSPAATAALTIGAFVANRVATELL